MFSTDLYISEFDGDLSISEPHEDNFRKPLWLLLILVINCLVRNDSDVWCL